MNRIFTLPRISSWLFAFFVGSLLTSCGCTTARTMARTEDFSEEVQRARQVRQTQLAAVQHSIPPESQQQGVVRLGGGKPFSGIQPAGYEQPYSPPYSTLPCPPDPRLPVAGPNPFGVGVPLIELAEMPHPETYPDEYLCDGGDRDWPVHYGQNQRLGLDTEDTVAEYVDHHGLERMQPSSKVCVYAPRFASVRTVSQPVLGESLNTSVGMINTTTDGEMRTRLALSERVKRDAVGGVRMRSRASGMESELPGAGITQDLAAVMHDKINNLFQSYNFDIRGDLDQTTAGRLNYGLRAALAWSREASPLIAGQVEQPVEGLFEISATTLTVIDDKVSDEPGQLQIAKFADKHDAQPGDVITFTIRYRNVGPREVHYVRIVDNLTPRLVYIEDSATSDRDGRLAVEDNGEGSLVLTWELSELLPADAGGLVTFQARVR